MKSLKVARMNIEGVMKSAIIYYGAFIFILMVLISLYIFGGRVTMSGIEVSTVIFLFVCGLNSFKSNFYFAKSNGISRKTFIKGLLISSIPIALVMSIIDIIINRINNIFIKNPTLYDVSYGNLLGDVGRVYEGVLGTK